MLLVDEGVDEEEGSIRADEDDGSVDGADEDNGNDGADKEERADEEEERADNEVGRADKEVGSTGDVDNEASADRSDNGDDADAGKE